MMISIIDYKMGNIRSIENALLFLGYEYKIVNTKDEILNSEKVILPGVGSFRQAMQNIKDMDLYDAIRELALNEKVDILGICLGMQLLADFSQEDGGANGLGLISGKVCKLSSDDEKLKIPHIGFNSIHYKNKGDLFDNLKELTDFYFVHSYHFIVDNETDVSSYFIYGDTFTASVQKGNIFGTQFHPEKSQANGLRVLKNFAELKR
jgi:glutamine amidotransferase